MQNVDETKLAGVEGIIGLKFKSKPLLVQSFTHESFIPKDYRGLPASYQRVEFLGDSILKMVTSIHYYKVFPEASESRLTVCRYSLLYLLHSHFPVLLW